jgi:uncharacterized protein DUF1707/2TM domain-containing protein
MDRDPGGQRRASLRASDADREQFVEALRRHHAEGRLTIDELTERTERAYAARTLGDLDALATDLPPLPGPSAAPAAAAPGGPAPRPAPQPDWQAAARAALVRSLLWYGLLSLVLVVIWAMGDRDYFWPVWPILGFALLLGWQAFGVLGPQPPDRSRRPGRGR